MSTLVGCTRRLMLQEHAYHEALQRVARFAVAGEELTLSDAAGTPVLRFRVRAPTPLVGTVWRAVLYHDEWSLRAGPWAADRTAAFGEDGRVTGVSGRITYAAPYTTHGEAGTGTIRIGPPTTALGPAQASVPLTPEAVERWVVREHLAGLREDAPSGTLSAAEEEAATREILATVRAAFAAAPVDEAPPPPSDEDEQTVARAYLGALQEAVSYRVLGHELTLQRPGGYTAVQLVPAAPPERDA